MTHDRRRNATSRGCRTAKRPINIAGWISLRQWIYCRRVFVLKASLGRRRGRLNIRQVPDPGPHGSFARKISKLNTESPPRPVQDPTGIISLAPFGRGPRVRPARISTKFELIFFRLPSGTSLGHQENRQKPRDAPGLLATQEIACDDLAALGLPVHGTLLVDRRSSVAVSAAGIDPGHAA